MHQYQLIKFNNVSIFKSHLLYLTDFGVNSKVKHAHELPCLHAL